eukprot:TRINITY_DN2094_c0_g1_i1.p2 TRINITY_DN2094_c0_g1~~TRINITY_DN2094_c0_g1_i1.p2  ORF type:complete len:443 (-),score=48.01 TRINITY_DN2094_c0_g1_i1:5010-6338(-)
MGNNSPTSLQGKGRAGLYGVVDATIVSLEVDGDESAPSEAVEETAEEENVADKLEAIALRNHKLHNSRGKTKTEMDTITTARTAPPTRKKMIAPIAEPEEATIDVEEPEKPVIEEQKRHVLAKAASSDQTEIITEEQPVHLPQIRHYKIASPSPILSGTLTSIKEFESPKKKPATEVKSRNHFATLAATTRPFVPSMLVSAHQRIIEKKVDSVKKNFYYGTIYRYHPELLSKYVKRVAEASERSFRYFGTNYGYWLTFPLLSVEYSEILTVRCVKHERQKKEKVTKHLFEISLKNNKSKQNKNTSIGFNTETIYENGMKESPDKLAPIKKVYMVNGVSFISKEQAQSYLEFTQKNSKAITRTHKLEKVVKGAKRNEGNTEELEERMFFGTDTMEECEKWVGLLLWILSTKLQSYFAIQFICLLCCMKEQINNESISQRNKAK